MNSIIKYKEKKKKEWKKKIFKGDGNTFYSMWVGVFFLSSI